MPQYWQILVAGCCQPCRSGSFQAAISRKRSVWWSWPRRHGEKACRWAVAKHGQATPSLVSTVVLQSVWVAPSLVNSAVVLPQDIGSTVVDIFLLEYPLVHFSSVLHSSLHPFLESDSCELWMLMDAVIIDYAPTRQALLLIANKRPLSNHHWEVFCCFKSTTYQMPFTNHSESLLTVVTIATATKKVSIHKKLQN